MSAKELESERTKLAAQLKLKEKELDGWKKKLSEIKSKDQISRAGDEDGRVEELTEKWIDLCQRVLLEIQSKASTQPSIGEVIRHFGIDPSLIRYNEELDSFS
jgi:hypothetical protein